MEEPEDENLIVIRNEATGEYVSLSSEMTDTEFTQKFKDYKRKPKDKGDRLLKRIEEYVIHADVNYYNNITYFKDIVNRISNGFEKFSKKDTKTEKLEEYIALVLPYFYKCKSGDIKFGDCDVTKLTKEKFENLGFMWREKKMKI